MNVVLFEQQIKFVCTQSPDDTDIVSHFYSFFWSNACREPGPHPSYILYDQIERWILNLNFPGFSKLKIFFIHKLVVLLVTSVPNFTSRYSLVFELRFFL